MTYGRDDRYIADALGRALPAAQVYWCTQPASTGANPPSPLAATFTDSTGDTPLAQPVLADGFGHAYAYLNNAELYTVVVWHPLFGSNPVVLEDQAISGASSGSSGVTPFSQTPAGPINGSNVTFTLTVSPQTLLILQYNSAVLVNGSGYTTAIVNGVFTITLAVAPQIGDVLYAFGIL
jgi:hypothetical protein